MGWENLNLFPWQPEKANPRAFPFRKQPGPESEGTCHSTGVKSTVDTQPMIPLLTGPSCSESLAPKKSQPPLTSHPSQLQSWPQACRNSSFSAVSSLTLSRHQSTPPLVIKCFCSNNYHSMPTLKEIPEGLTVFSTTLFS